MSQHQLGAPVEASLPARLIRTFSVPILFIWIAIAALSNTLVPQLEVVGWERSVGLNAPDAPSILAMRHIGQTFHEFDSDSAAMVVIEGDQLLGNEAHKFYEGLVKKLQADTRHVQHVQDFWGDPLTAGGSQSKDGKAALTQVYLSGNQGEALSNESVDAVRKIVADTPAPPGVRAYVTGASPLQTDNFEVGSAGTNEVTAITFLVIGIMLLFVYRSVITMLIVLVTVSIELAAARGVVAMLAHSGLIGLSTYATNILTLLAIAAGTDYAIFVVGRYQEARSKGLEQIVAYYDMWRGTVHVIVGSGLTIAGAVACMAFTRLPYFQTLGIPSAIGVVVTLVAALTLGPAVLLIASRFGLMEPKGTLRARGWRRIGTAIVRWPGPILVVTLGIALIGVFALTGYQTSYDNRPYIPASAPGVIGMQAAERHFTQARINPELLMIETDHDMRNPADMLILERAARAALHTPGVALVQSITRPLGTPITHSSIPFQISATSASQIMNLGYQRDRANDLLKQAREIDNTINVLKQQLELQKQSATYTHEQTEAFHDTVVTVNELRDKLGNFDDQLRPLRNYFYWEPHCFDIPMCSALRSVFDSLDAISELSDKFTNITASLDKLDALQPQLVALLPPQIAIQQRNRDLTLSNYATSGGTNAQSEEALKNATAMGQAFDDAKNDDTFYLPPEAFDNADFKRGLKLFLSPDGKAARFIVTHQGNPADPQAIPHIDAMKNAVFDALKATPMSDAKIYVAGIASTNKDLQQGMTYDLLISALAALALILLIMMFATRSLVAAFVIVGTVALSLGASVGLAVLVWQYIFGVRLFWVVIPLSIVLLLAVGADYNLLLVSRFKEELHAGLNAAIIRSMAGTGRVVTAAGLVFSATMAAFIFSDLVILGQVGTTIGLGLLFDTLIVRSFMTPSIAALLGKWFWWPQPVRQRPVPQPWPAPIREEPEEALS